jgi:hypothetical protein
LIEDSINETAIKFDWHSFNFGAIADEVRRLDFKQRYLEWKIKVSKDKKHKAGIEVEMLMKEARIFVVFFTSDDILVKKVKLLSVRPARFFILPLWVRQDG